ncbi:MAG TPA: hypothetical protein VFT98_16665, partial [Myxococcota bacterium]|nr:hypothetical protein [Myxococcota bacterium]
MSESALSERLSRLGKALGEREAEHRAAVAEAWRHAQTLRGEVAEALAGFHEAAAATGAPHLRVELGPLRLDDKHVRAVEFDLTRGR